MLSKTEAVYFELSNRCNMAAQHKLCPLHGQTEAIFLSTSLVVDVLGFLGSEKFAGRIAFHNYNEPLMDPRLFALISVARRLCPEAKIFIMTNGYMLDQTILNELVEAGVREIEATAYSDSESSRLFVLQHDPAAVAYRVRAAHGLDDRVGIYDRRHGRCSPCKAPLRYILVYCTGEVGLCCMDYERRTVFGDLRKESIADILEAGDMHTVYDRLSAGDRFLPICQGCKCPGR